MQQHRPVVIEVPGKPSEVDSFAVCLQAALKHWGRNVPYDCISGLAGTAFSPPLDRDARCPALWMEAGADVRMDFLAHALGFMLERGTGADLLDAGPARRFARRARATLGRNGVLLCRMTKCWNLAACASPEGGYELLGPGGAGSMGDLAPDARVYLLRPAERSLTSYEALQAALEFGALAASGACSRMDVAFGGRIYDAWLERLRQEAFCPDCGANEWLCAERTTGRARRSHVAAVRFLNRAYAFLPPRPNSEGLRAAADAFAAMATSLAPYADGDMQRTWHDGAERARYTESVAHVRDLHQQAAEHLSEAAGGV
jgi:hypothetical protein